MELSLENRSSRSTSFPLASLALSMLLSSSGTSMPNVALPALAEAFAVPLPEIQWVILAYLLSVTSLIVGAGRLGDALGRRRALLFGVSVFALSALLCGLAPNLRFLISARLAQGIGAAILMANTLAAASEIVPPEKLGRSMGFLGTMSAVGTAIGPTLGGLILEWGNWRSVFGVMALLGLLAFALMKNFLPTSDAKARADLQQLNLPGTGLLAVVLGSGVLLFTLGQARRSSFSWLLLALVAGSASLFAWNETRTRSPLVRWATLRDSNVLASLGMNALVSMVMMSTLVVAPFYLSRGLGLSAGSVGMVMSVGPIFSMLSGIPAGRMVDRLGASRAATFGLLELAIGALTMAWLPPVLGVAGYVISSGLMSPGYQMFQAANQASLLGQARSAQRGVLSGLLGLARNLGLILGTAVMGALFSRSTYGIVVASTPVVALTDGLRTTFTSAAGLAGLALWMGIRRLRCRE